MIFYDIKEQDKELIKIALETLEIYRDRTSIAFVCTNALGQ